MIKKFLNSVIAKYRDLSMSRTSIICLSLRLRQIIDLLATDKSRYFAQLFGGGEKEEKEEVEGGGVT